MSSDAFMSESTVDIVKMHEGGYGFYKGLLPALLRVTPACCITFVIYENMITYLLHGDNKKNGVGVKDDKVNATIKEDITVDTKDTTEKIDSIENTNNDNCKKVKTV